MLFKYILGAPAANPGRYLDIILDSVLDYVEFFFLTVIYRT